MSLRDTASQWLDAEPDDDMRIELAALLDGDPAELVARFDGCLQFGTAGLRAAVGAGPLRMNRLVVRQAAAGLADYLLSSVPDAAIRGVVIGFDARRKSDAFALDTARVLAARGVRALLFRNVVPTPVLAWNITEPLAHPDGAAGGVMVTASHNPPADNGYKVYLATGSQIVSPVDAEIAARIARVDPTAVPLAEPTDPLITVLGDDVVERYVRAVGGGARSTAGAAVRVAYTPLHGVGGDVLLRSFAAAGLAPPTVVASQFQPDGTFPTVSFPNPEEPGAMDQLCALAADIGADVAIANDPDADRMGVAVPLPDGSWRRLSGDEVGWLLADHLLHTTSGNDRLVVTTVVSSVLLSKMAEAAGVQFRETFTGFKWIGHTALEHPNLRLVLGYEQALGYLVGRRPLDKDGISAAIAFVDVVGAHAAQGRTVVQRLEQIAADFGRHVTAERSVQMPPAEGLAAVARLRADPPMEVAGRAVTAVSWIDAAGLLRLQLGDSLRLQVRPSGTEPKVKVYGEGIDLDPAPWIAALADLLC